MPPSFATNGKDAKSSLLIMDIFDTKLTCHYAFHTWCTTRPFFNSKTFLALSIIHHQHSLGTALTKPTFVWNTFAITTLDIHMQPALGRLIGYAARASSGVILRTNTQDAFKFPIDKTAMSNLGMWAILQTPSQSFLTEPPTRCYNSLPAIPRNLSKSELVAIRSPYYPLHHGPASGSGNPTRDPTNQRQHSGRVWCGGRDSHTSGLYQGQRAIPGISMADRIARMRDNTPSNPMATSSQVNGNARFNKDLRDSGRASILPIDLAPTMVRECRLIAYEYTSHITATGTKCRWTSK